MRRASYEDVIQEEGGIKHTVVCEKCGNEIETWIRNRSHRRAEVLCDECLHENKFDYEPK